MKIRVQGWYTIFLFLYGRLLRWIYARLCNFSSLTMWTLFYFNSMLKRLDKKKIFTPVLCVKKLFEHFRYIKKNVWKQAAWSFMHNILNESHKTILEKLIQNLKCFLFHAKFIFKTPLIIVKISNICSIYMYIGYPKLLKPWKWISIIQYNCFPIIIRPIISHPLKSHSH